MHGSVRQDHDNGQIRAGAIQVRCLAHAESMKTSQVTIESRPCCLGTTFALLKKLWTLQKD
jgi:hypothetical protein